MEKLESRTYRGIDFIRINELPNEQYDAFMNWVGKDSIITIQIDGEVQKNCVQYSDYSYWFESIFSIDDSKSANRGVRGHQSGVRQLGVSGR